MRSLLGECDWGRTLIADNNSFLSNSQVSSHTLSHATKSTGAPHNLPITCIQRRSTLDFPDASSVTPEPLALHYRFSLPALSQSIKSEIEPTWLPLLARASEKSYTIELDIVPEGTAVGEGQEADLERRREEVEELLSRAYEAEIKALAAANGGGDEQQQENQQQEPENTKPDEEKYKGIKIVLNGLAGPPNIPSSKLSRSQALDNWTAFVSVSGRRLAISSSNCPAESRFSHTHDPHILTPTHDVHGNSAWHCTRAST